jgi:Dolichyl-phosphate-mannose-protein mannosyltransferase
MPVPPKRVHYAAAALVIAGGALRLYAPWAIEFRRDEIEALDLGIRLLRDQPWSSPNPWPEHGMLSSNEVANAPLFNWVMAAFWAVTHHPVGATALVAILNTVALYPFWRWARRHLDDERALLSLALMSVSPFAVMFSRKLWAQELLFPGLVLLCWGVEWLLSDRFWRGVILLGLAVLIVGQLHQSGPIALVFLPIAFGLQQLIARRSPQLGLGVRKPSPWEAAALAAVVGLNLFFWIPYLRYLVHLSPQVIAQRPIEPCCRPALLRDLVEQLLPRDLFFFFEREEFMRGAVRPMLFYLAVGFGAPISAYGIWRWLVAPSSVPVFGLWWWFIIAAFALARIPTYPFYVLILAPLPALLASGAFDGWLARGRFARAFSYTRWSYAIVLGCLTFATFWWFQDRGGKRDSITYGVREAQARAIMAPQPDRSSSVYETDGTITSADPSGVRNCGPVPQEVKWIIEHVAGRPTPLDSVRLCDAWREQDGRLRYRWTIRAAAER